MALFGLDQEVIDSRFPWICIVCRRREHGCPMNIDLMKMRSAGTLTERDEMPGVLDKGFMTCLTTGNSVALRQTISSLSWKTRETNRPRSLSTYDRVKVKLQLTSVVPIR